ALHGAFTSATSSSARAALATSSVPQARRSAQPHTPTTPPQRSHNDLHTGPTTIAHDDCWLDSMLYCEAPPTWPGATRRYNAVGGHDTGARPRGTARVATSEAQREARAPPAPPCPVGEPAMTHADPGPFGDLLFRLRAAAGLTQEQLAARAGISPKAIA